jgi:hypothetical protein
VPIFIEDHFSLSNELDTAILACSFIGIAVSTGSLERSGCLAFFLKGIKVKRKRDNRAKGLDIRLS